MSWRCCFFFVVFLSLSLSLALSLFLAISSSSFRFLNSPWVFRQWSNAIQFNALKFFSFCLSQRRERKKRCNSWFSSAISAATKRCTIEFFNLSRHVWNILKMKLNENKKKKRFTIVPSYAPFNVFSSLLFILFSFHTETMSDWNEEKKTKKQIPKWNGKNAVFCLSIASSRFKDL